ncbi:2,3-bisphosphoglycerate-independent phosphoglycerate mutase [Lacrimispora saccharolytica]|uniref:2,3-bisphosphoglycerate-independent phosphoglycerate mutase n=1 Tax=Lacrimispora saccharolytica (strain ATCC 35040 / DSM 2544 / NRCC 2533 / WM1) TaxID=610130 RepID=D9R620_LACSW|nr:2,3-bisphosphoglycerate-independent phosphoglycerate mutase [Lacrimispora saccharolytica]ADL03454.1 phosphoglycerate mutase, 2,3-bisphosphoglycerate-independent [[Clostridium] saccharolyticum WM1]QRV18396.1 2,3-bisphosphoglycerate-independent phosphoglycerate mutase [Lacrimispora saccharolytica]
MSRKPVVLMILDGYGLNDNCDHNAVCEGKTPIMDQLMSQCPFVKGNASGLAVGLPDGQMGNSEVGHLNMGAGRIVYQELTRITKSIEDGDFFEVAGFLQAVENCKKTGSALHMWGLVSDGGVHSHNTHIYGLLELAKRKGLDKVYVHCFLDGRDTPPASGKNFVEALEEKMKELGTGKVASVMGRYYAMDRDNRWDRVERAYNALTKGEGNHGDSATAGIQASYDKEIYDEFVEPFVVTEDGKPVATVKDGDSVIFFNFRPDRAREITRAFCDDEFKGFGREKRLELTYVCFTDYDETIHNKLVAFKKESIANTFGEFLAQNDLTQARIAETEKYAHVTFFFNGGVEEPNKGEDRILVPSPKVATYDLQPEMSAPMVCDKLVEAIQSGKYDVIIVNFANPDMVGHTGIEAAAIKAIETVDACVGRTVEAIREADGMLFICADHGNAEQLLDYETGEPFTAHTTNPVPFILVNADPAYQLREGGCLADIAPTLIQLMGLKQPEEMTGRSLLVK